jgi:hypothetical protein
MEDQIFWQMKPPYSADKLWIVTGGRSHDYPSSLPKNGRPTISCQVSLLQNYVTSSYLYLSSFK